MYMWLSYFTCIADCCLTIVINRFEELTNSIKQLKNHKKIKDISKVLTGLLDCSFTKDVSF